MQSYLEFEKPVADLQGKVQELKSLAQSGEAVEIEDEVKNLKVLTDKIVEIYKKYTTLEEEELDSILKHDLWWDSKKCLESKLVDKIANKKQLYSINPKKIRLD